MKKLLRGFWLKSTSRGAGCEGVEDLVSGFGLGDAGFEGVEDVVSG